MSSALTAPLRLGDHIESKRAATKDAEDKIARTLDGRPGGLAYV